LSLKKKQAQRWWSSRPWQNLEGRSLERALETSAVRDLLNLEARPLRVWASYEHLHGKGGAALLSHGGRTTPLRP